MKPVSEQDWGESSEPYRVVTSEAVVIDVRYGPSEEQRRQAREAMLVLPFALRALRAFLDFEGDAAGRFALEAEVREILRKAGEVGGA